MRTFLRAFGAVALASHYKVATSTLGLADDSVRVVYDACSTDCRGRAAE